MVKIKIKNLAKVESGSTPSTAHSEYYDGNIVWLTPKDLSDQNKKYIDKSSRNITLEGYKKSSCRILSRGTVLLSSRAPIGLLAIANVELCTNQGFKNLVVDKTKINSEFLYYQLKTHIKHLNQLGSKTTFKEITKRDLEEFEIEIPESIIEQEKIASILSTLDSKIELNNKINSELEQMVKTLYDYWFVQFDFPDKNGKPYKFGGGKMVYNEELKTEIPEGWEVKKVSELIAEDKSGDWGKDEATGNYKQEVFCIRGADINGLNGKEQCEPPRRFILEKNEHKLLKPYDLIIEISGGSPTQSTGRIAHISPTTAKRFSSSLICSNFCKALTLKDNKLTYNFQFFWNRLYDNKIFFGYEGKTSGIKNLLFDSFVSTNYMIIPNDQTKNNFFDFMENTEEKIQKVLEENQNLASLRDWLLPMLMNGQVTVK